MKLAIRGFQGGTKVFEDRVDLPEGELSNLLSGLAERHANLLKESPHMIEIEFLDELDPLQRFFRFGTDPSRMVQPIEIDLWKKPN